MNLINSLPVGANTLGQNIPKHPIVLKSYPEDQPPTVKGSRIHISVSGDKQTGYSFFYNNLNWFDEELLYTFKPDGSATVISAAWGTKQEYPKGTFSELYEALPEKPEDFDFETAKNLLDANKEKAIKTEDAIQILQRLNVQKH